MECVVVEEIVKTLSFRTAAYAVPKIIFEESCFNTSVCILNFKCNFNINSF